MTEAFICDAVRTPIGRYGGGLSAVRTDDLVSATHPNVVNRQPIRIGIACHQRSDGLR